MKALLEEEGEKVTIEEDIENQRLKLKITTPLTTELFAEWKRKKQEEKDAELANKRAERARNDRMSGRELFASDASLFVDDIEAYERYKREEEPAIQDPSSTGQETQGGIRPNFGETSSAIITEEDELLLAEDDDDLDPDELEELEARIASSSMSDDR